MAGLVEKVKQSIRNRSRSRRSGEFESSDYNSRASTDAPRRSNQFQDDRVGRSSHAATPSNVSTTANLNKPLPGEQSVNGSSYVRDGNYNGVGDGSRQAATGSLARKPVNSATEEIVPDRTSSLKHHRNSSRTSQELEAARVDVDTLSGSPTAHGYTHVSANQGLDNRMNNLSIKSPEARSSGSSIGVSDSIRQRQTSDADSRVPPVPQIPQNAVNAANTVGGQSSPSSPTQTRHSGQISEHVRLPEGFRTGSTETTDVTTDWRPAITQETVYRNRTEIIQEAVTRDIHVHHYYTYVQPIKVVEVLPARHYLLDHETGIKKEIPAPLGWILPENLQSRQPDLSSIKGHSRHYLVNDQYPQGIPEAPPLRHKEDYDHLPAGQRQ